MKNLVASACSFSSREQELIDLGFSDYNPFCETIGILGRREMINVLE